MMETIQNHKREFGIGAIILAVLLIFSFYEYHEKKQAELAASQLELNGNVDLREVSLAFRNSDRITEILVDEGDTVKKGQVLAKLDTQDLNYKIDVTKSQIAAQQAVVDKMHNGTRPEDLAQAAAKVNAAKAEKDFLTADYNRKMDSYNTSGGKAISRQAIDDAKAKLDVASSKLTEAEQANNLAKAGPRAEDVAAAEAQLKGLQDTLAGQEYTLSQSELIAPQDGVIRSRPPRRDRFSAFPLIRRNGSASMWLNRTLEKSMKEKPLTSISTAIRTSRSMARSDIFPRQQNLRQRACRRMSSVLLFFMKSASMSTTRTMSSAWACLRP